MSHPLILDIELGAIRSFLGRVASSVDAEYSEIACRAHAEAFADHEEESNAFFYPMMCEEIAIRATLGELNALVEWELQRLAVEPLTKGRSVKKAERPRTAWDLKRDDLYRLIEDCYHIRLDGFPGFGEVEEIRRVANAYKHRKGFKDPRPGKDSDWTHIPEKFQLEREKAFRYIEAVRDFLQALWKATAK